jgi:serine/threonine protein phosphatase PrpC
MEDAHVCLPQVPEVPDGALFAVFDGHGGREVAELCKKQLVSQVITSLVSTLCAR